MKKIKLISILILLSSQLFSQNVLDTICHSFAGKIHFEFDYYKSKIINRDTSVFLKDNAKEVEINQLQKSLAMTAYTKTATFVSKEEAAEDHSKEIGENFLDFLGYNPLQNSIDVHLNADYVATDSIQKIADNLSKKDYVAEVSYDKPLISLLNENVKRMSFWILIASGVFTLIAVLLISPFRAWPPKSAECIPERLPPLFPTGVLTASTIKASSIM